MAWVKGTVVATQKVAELTGLSLKVLVACDTAGLEIGQAFVAVDPIGVRTGDQVLWVGKREASLAIPGAELANSFPVDAAVTGIIDDYR